MLRAIDQKTKVHTLIIIFWAFFWLLNGGDKFFNGTFTHVDMPGVTRAAIIDDQGVKQYEIKDMEAIGWFGVNRDSKMINYFQRLHLPSWSALSALYSLAVLEVILGVLFFWLLATEYQESKNALVKDRVLHRLAFKLGVVIFILFTILDVLLGDRTELWEHSCYLILYLVSYDLWYRTDSYTNRPTEE